MIDFNVPPYVGTEMDYVREAAEVNHKICGDGPFSRKCHAWMEERFNAEKVLLTTSGTDALEMAANLCDLEPGDARSVIKAGPHTPVPVAVGKGAGRHAVNRKRCGRGGGGQEGKRQDIAFGAGVQAEGVDRFGHGNLLYDANGRWMKMAEDKRSCAFAAACRPSRHILRGRGRT